MSICECTYYNILLSFSFVALIHKSRPEVRERDQLYVCWISSYVLFFFSAFLICVPTM